MSILHDIWGVSLELAPWLFLGAAVSALMHKFLPPNFIKTQLSGYGGIIKAVLLGVPLPLCSCGVIPAGIGLKKDGASDGSSVAFLISTPQTGIDSVLVSVAFLGWPFALLKVVAATITGIFGGFITHWWVPQSSAQESQPKAVGPTVSWGDAFEHGVQLLRSIWLWLVVGILISASLNSFLPPETLSQVPQGFSSLFVALLISLPLYICATASVPIAASLVANGFPLSSALVFLMAGPASNLATIGSIYKTFGKKTTFVYLGTIVVFSMLFALLFDFILLPENQGMPDHHHESAWAAPFAIALFASFIFFAYEQYLKPRLVSQPKASSSIWVEGLTCGGCVAKLQKALNLLPSIEHSSVNLESGEVQLTGEASLQELKKITSNQGLELLLPQYEFHVDGLRCGGCVSKLQKVLNQVDGVQEAFVNLENKSARVDGKINADKILQAVNKAGFQII